MVGRDDWSGFAPAVGWAVMIGGYLGRGLGGDDLVAGDAACKGCRRWFLVDDLSASGLCENCLSAAFSASWARVDDARFWGSSDCPECRLSRKPASGSETRS